MQFTLILTIGLVVMVMFLFLRSLAATIIPSIAVPISLVGTFGVMYMFGYSLNNLSLMALTISTGFVVDDAIVMIENIARYIEAGESPLEAALKGSEQIGFTIVSLTVSLIAVLIPLLFMGDIVGRLFREFAITLSVAILVSAVVSLTLTPTMCAKLLRHHHAAEQGRLYRITERGFEAVIGWYATTLRWVLRHQPATLVVTVATLVLTIALYVVAPKGFFPVQDTGVILGISEAPEIISFTAMAERQQALAREILKDRDVVSLSSFIGVDGVNMTPNSGRIQINLKPQEERRRRPGDHPAPAGGARPRWTGSRSTCSRSRTSPSRIGSAARSTSTRSRPPTSASSASGRGGWPTGCGACPSCATWPWTSRTRACRPGWSSTATRPPGSGSRPQLIDDTLYDAFGQRQVSTIFTQLNQYHVILEVAPEFQDNPEALKRIYVKSPTGAQVPLSAFTRFDAGTAPLTINHFGQFPSVTLSFNLAPGASLGDAVSAMQKLEREIGLPAVRAGQLPGHGAGVPGRAGQRADPDPGRRDHRLHRAGRALRELHSSHHDPVHAALGRAWARSWRSCSVAPT